jgi:hypothetical protein
MIFKLFQSFLLSIFYLENKTMRFCFRSDIGQFLEDIADYQVKDFGYTKTQSQMQLISSITKHHYKCNGTCVREDNRDASGSWENYHMLDEHVCVTTLFLK